MLKGGDGRPLGPGLQKSLCTHKSMMLQPSELLIYSNCGEIRLRQAAKSTKPILLESWVLLERASLGIRQSDL